MTNSETPLGEGINIRIPLQYWWTFATLAISVSLMFDTFAEMEADNILQDVLYEMNFLKRAKAPGPRGFSIELIASLTQFFAPKILKLFKIYSFLTFRFDLVAHLLKY
ncbi:hypothetical protein NDU88_005111 [Pleurodeles waltl]|uniref:Uncharacterized protein n=1 Tax=Pleurodeles waltl TaxID=8319 RepID=A0AAV7NN05_PLEWA|nr:hypothetical protein NDU88_005111 [Pleurodeles waltl]